MSFQVPRIQGLEGQPLAQDKIREYFSQISQIPFMNGVQIENVTLASGDNTIYHGLKRPVVGYFILSQSAAATIYDKINSSSERKEKLILNSSASVVISLWVF
jgi:hypothetical protein